MRQTAIDKLQVFIILFIISLIMRIQIPIFTPYAAVIGASSIIIGIILSVTSLTNLVGNLFAGPLVDRFGKKAFITIPIFLSGLLFIAHGFAKDSVDLLILHGLNGFALAFLIPAAFALLSGYAKNSRQQGINMAINGILSTVASIVGPIVGGQMVVMIGYVNTYFFIGTMMLITSIYSTLFLRENSSVITVGHPFIKSQSTSSSRIFLTPNLFSIYIIGFAVMYIHGVLIFEIPYLAVEQGLSTLHTGKLFSYMGLGTLLTLSMLFINRFDPFKRLLVGLFGMSTILFFIINATLSLPLLLFSIGTFFGLITPAMATALTEGTSNDVHGRAFGYMSAIYSLGIICSSAATGVIRNFVSPYFIAFLIGMIVLTIAGFIRFSSNARRLYHV